MNTLKTVVVNFDIQRLILPNTAFYVNLKTKNNYNKLLRTHITILKLKSELDFLDFLSVLTHITDLPTLIISYNITSSRQ